MGLAFKDAHTFASLEHQNGVSNVKMRSSRIVNETALNEIVVRLVTHCYPELQKRPVCAKWARISSFGDVSWDDRGPIVIRCNEEVNSWHEAQLTGLLAHELSHPAQIGNMSTEEDTDLDVIKRGLGTYLAAERIAAGKYIDHKIRGGRDRYLGYRTIRSELTSNEAIQLDTLLKMMRIVPALKREKASHIPYDLTIVNKDEGTYIRVEGYEFLVKEIPDEADIRLVVNGKVVHLYLNDKHAGSLPLDEA